MKKLYFPITGTQHHYGKEFIEPGMEVKLVKETDNEFCKEAMNKPLDLCNADINKAVFKNVMFFSIAEGGAMGEPGGVLFYVESGELYHFNYVYGDVDIKKVEEMFPTLTECKFGLFGIDSQVPKGWKYVSLGMGNHLIMKENVYEQFMDKFSEEMEPSIIYQNWVNVARDILLLL